MPWLNTNWVGYVPIYNRLCFHILSPGRKVCLDICVSLHSLQRMGDSIFTFFFGSIRATTTDRPVCAVRKKKKGGEAAWVAQLFRTWCMNFMFAICKPSLVAGKKKKGKSEFSHGIYPHYISHNWNSANSFDSNQKVSLLPLTYLWVCVLNGEFLMWLSQKKEKSTTTTKKKNKDKNKKEPITVTYLLIKETCQENIPSVANLFSSFRTTKTA